MAAAMTALATANIFRDMSGRAEVADLLKKLSDNSVAIAGVAQKAATGGASGGSGADTSGGTSSTGDIASTPPTGSSGVSAPPSSNLNVSQPPQQPSQTSEQRESAQIDNSRKTGLTAIDVLPPGKKRNEVFDKVGDDLAKTKIKWQVVFTSEWNGEGIIQEPMQATYDGYLRFGELLNDWAFLQEQSTNSEAIWTVDHPAAPLVLHINVVNPSSPGGAFSVQVPPLDVSGLVLSARSYDVPLRGGLTMPTKLERTLNGIKSDPKNPTLSFQGVGKIGRKEIEITSKVNTTGEILGEFGKEFAKEATIEIVKLAIKSTLKAAVRATVGGELGIKGTYEIIYLIGYDVKQT